HRIIIHDHMVRRDISQDQVRRFIMLDVINERPRERGDDELGRPQPGRQQTQQEHGGQLAKIHAPRCSRLTRCHHYSSAAKPGFAGTLSHVTSAIPSTWFAHRASMNSVSDKRLRYTATWGPISSCRARVMTWRAARPASVRAPV